MPVAPVGEPRLKSLTNLTHLAIGKLLSPFALAGGIKVKSYDTEASYYKKFVGAELVLRRDDGELCLKVSGALVKGDTPVLIFEGYPSPEAVAKLTGYELWIERGHLRPLAKGEFYLTDLMGVDVMWQGQSLGKIVNYFETGQLVLEVDCGDKMVLVPFVEHYFGDPNFTTRQLELLNNDLF